MSITRSDGLAQFELYSRADGLSFFTEHSWRNEGYSDDPRWKGRDSGLYQSQEDALRDALAAFDWLKSEIPE